MRFFNSADIEFYRRKIILESVDIKKASLSTYSKNVFLSHSSKDVDMLPSVINFLEKYGAKVYIDKNDTELPRVTSPETAKILKDNIKKCDKFILLITENSRDSRWIPWELGIADIAKNINNVALFPSTDALSPSWVKQEYLGLYSKITKNAFKGSSNEVWMVYDAHKNTGVELSQWLKK